MVHDAKGLNMSTKTELTIEGYDFSPCQYDSPAKESYLVVVKDKQQITFQVEDKTVSIHCDGIKELQRLLNET